MFATIVISLIAILFAFLARYKEYSHGLEIAFIILTIFISIRYNWGNDYPGYLGSFLYIGSFSNIDLTDFRTEVGWNFINHLFQPIGFFGMTILLTIFEYYVIYRLIKKYVPKKWYWLSVFIFTFNTAYMLVCASMMRQFLAMCIFIIAVEFIIKKRWIISILLVLLASLFHASALILLLFCFLGYFNISLTKANVIIWFVIYLLSYFFAVEIFGNLFFKIIEIKQFENYQYYLFGEQGKKGTGLGVIFNMIMYIFLLLNQKYQNKDVKIIFVLYAISVFFYVFSDVAPLTGRLGFYFSIFGIVCLPIMFCVMKNKLFGYFLMVGYILITIKTFFGFFDSTGIWFKGFFTYQTIFSASSWM